MPCYNCVYVSTKNQIKKREVENLFGFGKTLSFKPRIYQKIFHPPLKV